MEISMIVKHASGIEPNSSHIILAYSPHMYSLTDVWTVTSEVKYFAQEYTTITRVVTGVEFVTLPSVANLLIRSRYEFYIYIGSKQTG